MKTTDFGKIQPQAIEVEEAVIAACMLDESIVGDVASVIYTHEAFYKPSNQVIWKAIQQLSREHSNIDLLTVSEQVKKNGELELAGGVSGIMRLSNQIGSAAHAEEHARLVIEKYLLRKFIEITATSNSEAFNETADVFSLLDGTANQIEALNLALSGQGQKAFGDIVFDKVQAMREAAQSGNYITGTQTFSDALDRHLLGFQKENLIIIAGRPGMGKTTVAWHIAAQQARNGIPVGFFSLEMSDGELIEKLFSSEISVDGQTVRKGGLKGHEWQSLDERLKDIQNYPIQLNDTAGLTIHQLIAIGRNWVRKQGVKVIYIDYIGKIKTGMKFGSREQEVAYISGALKDFAKQMKITVVLLAQLSRAVEQRGGMMRPNLSDLRESGAIEQDADIVIFPYRPEYYDIREIEGQLLPPGYTELDIAKFRHGMPGTVRWIFEPQFSRFTDY